MDRVAVVKRLFEHFYNKLYKSNHKIDLSVARNKTLITNFIDLLIKQYTLEAIGSQFLFNYIAYSFEQYANKNLKRRISLNWIVGRKMFSKWLNRRDSWDYYVDKFLREHSVDLQLIDLVNEEKKDPLATYRSEELEKSRLPDSEARVYNCLQTTTLYNHRSLICITCHQRSFCKQLLNKVNPKLYASRGYGS